MPWVVSFSILSRFGRRRRARSPRRRRRGRMRVLQYHDDGVVVIMRASTGLASVVSRLAGARLCVISGPVLPRVVVGARPGHASPAKCEVARHATLFETTHGQRRHAPRSMLAARTAGRTARRPQTPNAQAAPQQRCKCEEARVKNRVASKILRRLHAIAEK